MSKKKKITFSLLLFLMIFLACVVAAEITLRSATQLHYIYNAAFFYLPDYMSKHHEYMFLEAYKNKKHLDMKNYDPVLGWDYNKDNNGIRGSKTYSIEKPAEITRIVAIGDSFTYGNEVKDDECFPYLVSRMLKNTEVLNMGVGGYGIGQPYIKYVMKGRQYNPDIVIFGIHSNDVDRTGLTFFSHAKPLFKFDEKKGKLVIENSPVPAPDVGLERIRRQAFREFRLGIFLRNLYNHIPSVREKAVTKYYFEMAIVIKSLLNALKTELETSGKTLLIVNIPPGDDFSSERSFRGGTSADKFLTNIYDELKLDYINLSEEFVTAEVSRETVFKDYYIHRDTGEIGHLAVEGNRVAAELIADFISGAGWAELNDNYPVEEEIPGIK